MIRVVTAVMLCGLAIGCGGPKATPPADDPETLRRIEEEGAKEAQREDDAARKAPPKGRDEE